MIRRTTPRQKLILPFKITDVKKTYIAYGQRNKPVFEINDDIIHVDGNVMTYNLTQNETAMLSAGLPVEIQVICVTKTEKIIASNIIRTNVDRILKEEYINVEEMRPTHYDGAYIVEPNLFTDVVLRTENKILGEDVVVKKISWRTEENGAGGDTLIIA